MNLPIPLTKYPRYAKGVGKKNVDSFMASLKTDEEVKTAKSLVLELWELHRRQGSSRKGMLYPSDHIKEVCSQDEALIILRKLSAKGIIELWYTRIFSSEKHGLPAQAERVHIDDPYIEYEGASMERYIGFHPYAFKLLQKIMLDESPTSSTARLPLTWDEKKLTATWNDQEKYVGNKSGVVRFLNILSKVSWNQDTVLSASDLATCYNEYNTEHAANGAYTKELNAEDAGRAADRALSSLIKSFNGATKENFPIYRRGSVRRGLWKWLKTRNKITEIKR